MSFASRLLKFYRELRPPQDLPAGIQWLFPQQNPQVIKVVEAFLEKFYNDNRPRRLILGINPGRFGAGTTGINFTAPKQLTELGIPHPFPPNQTELSAEFINQAIRACGGPEIFYSRYFISAVCPLGFTRGGTNLNYYDDPQLLRALTPFITGSIRAQMKMGFLIDHCFCIGGGKNLKFLSLLNEKNKFFHAITPLAHPRFIMQYRRKQLADYIRLYSDALA